MTYFVLSDIKCVEVVIKLHLATNWNIPASKISADVQKKKTIRNQYDTIGVHIDEKKKLWTSDYNLWLRNFGVSDGQCYMKIKFQGFDRITWRKGLKWEKQRFTWSDKPNRFSFQFKICNCLVCPFDRHAAATLVATIVFNILLANASTDICLQPG